MISAEHSSEQPDLFAYEEVEPLIAALGDPEEAVRIAVLRVLLRLGKYLDQRTIEEVRLHAQYELSRAELEYITYLPSEAVLSRLLRDLERFGRAVHEVPVPEDYDEESFQHLSTEEASRLITEHFAALASEKIPYAHWSDIREGAGDGIAGQVSRLGSKFKPDISALFYVYVTLLERASNEKREFLTQLRDQDHLDITRNWPSWWRWGPVTVSWQIAWAASRAGVRAILRAIGPAAREGASGVRWASAQFIEESARWTLRSETLAFGGGAGPEDVDLSSVWQAYREEVRSESVAEPGPAAAPPSAPSTAPISELTRDLVVKSIRLVNPRYADFTFYNEFPDGKRGAALSFTDTLQASSRYQLEVSIRAKRRGIRPVDTAESIREPNAKQPVSILVVADSPDHDFDIPEPVQRLTLPPDGDSCENAWFRSIVARRRTNTTDELLHLRVRLYYNLNLIEVVIIEAEAVSPLEDAHRSRLALDEPVRFQQVLREREYRNLDLLLPRSMHIQVTPIPGGFHLAFLLGREGRPNVLLPGTARISEADLENSLCEIRKSLFGITVWDAFGKGTVCADEWQFNKGLSNLARLGRDLWTKIFEVERGSSLFQIGEWLRNHPLPPRSLIQVTTDPGAYAFVLPWNLLYDRDLPDDPDSAPDVDGFWGIRYQVEQRAAIPDTTNDRPYSAANIDIGFLTWPFEEVSLQRAFLDGMVSLSRGRIGELHSIDSAQAALAYLSAGGDGIICFFAHGHTQFREASEVGFSEADFVRLYETLPDSSDLRGAWKYAYEQIKQRQYESDRSWIQLRSGRVYLPQLYQKRDLKLDKRPIVLLNMCESAQLTPSLRESFIHFFLDRGAIAVIGTECSMRPLFAHHFAKELLGRLLTGSALGQAILDVRLHFLRQRNPLGLAYTLFGSPLARFDPALLEGKINDLSVSESSAAGAGTNPEEPGGV